MKCKTIIGLLILSSIALKAQDRQFWDQAVGSKAALLGGIVVAGVDDYSATYYNPGALSFLSKKSMSVNFNMYGIKDFQFYMIYANGYSYVRVSERYEGYADVIPTRPPSQPGFPNAFEGDEFLINEGKIDALLSEVSVGFGYANKISDNVGVGFTLIGAYRDQTKVRYESYAAFDTTNQRTANTGVFVDLDYWAVRFSGKFGLAVEWKKVKLGVTLTTPSIALKFASGGTDGV
ncbi:MAG: hypothetical protein P8X73_16215, partial [Ignavibacteriaceae bacterium]